MKLLPNCFERDAETPDVMKPVFARMVSFLRLECLPEAMMDKLWSFASANEDLVAAELLGSLAIGGHEGAKEELLRRSTGRDLHALAALGPITSLDEDAARNLVIDFEARVRAIIRDAEKGSYGFGGSDPAHGLAIFNHWFLRVARWDVLVEFLANPNVAGEHKRSTCQTLVALGSCLSAEVRKLLGGVLEGLKALATANT